MATYDTKKLIIGNDTLNIKVDTSGIGDGSVTRAKLATDLDNIVTEVIDIRTGVDGATHSSAGDAVRWLGRFFENGIDYGYTNSLYTPLEIGRIKTANGEDSSSNYYIRSVGYFESDSDIVVRKTTSGSLYILKYSSDDTYLGYTNFSESAEEGTVPATEGVKYRLTYTRIPQTTVSDANAWGNDFILLNGKSKKIQEIENNIQSITSVLDDKSVNYGFTEGVPIEWKVGFISSSTGRETSGTGAVIPVQAVSLSGDVVIRKIPSSIMQVYAYSTDETFVRTGVDEGVTDFKLTVDAEKTYKFCFYRVPIESSVTVEDLRKDFSIAYASNKLPFLARYSDVSGKKWVTLGDSLTDPVTLSVYSGDETKNYADIVAERLGLTLTNLGKSGTGYWRKSTVSPYMAFFQRASDIPLDTDIVTLFGSFNDMGRDGDVLGRDILGTTYDTTTDTVGGCINQAFLNIFERVPNAVVGVILPTPWNAMTTDAAEIAIYEPYVELVRSIAERYSLPVLDLFHHSDLRPWNADFKTTYYLSVDDGTHPNHYGHMRISGMIADFVESLARCN